MIIAMVPICVVFFAVLVVVKGIRLHYGTLSTFELERRAAKGDKVAVQMLWREALLSDMQSLQYALSSILLTGFTLVSVATFGWLLGSVVAVIVAVEYGAIARIPLISSASRRLYGRYEPHILPFIERHANVVRLFRSNAMTPPEVLHPGSREELLRIVSYPDGLISSEERKRILHGLQFTAKHVSDVLTPRDAIYSIDKKELLGPLTLDELHRTGHSCFPVYDGDVDHIVGMLHVQDLLTLDTKRSVTAEKAMESRVFYIREDQPLDRALAAFLRVHHHLLVVVNASKETVGLLSLNDVMEVLLGHKIIDEFDAHDDVRAVATRDSSGYDRIARHDEL